MSTATPGRLRDPHWQNLYEAAILQTDTTKLWGRVEEAKEAIHAHMGELALSDQNGQWEKLSDALNVLQDLIKIQKARHPEPPKAEH